MIACRPGQTSSEFRNLVALGWHIRTEYEGQVFL